MATNAVAQHGVSIALACRAFEISETCFLYSPVFFHAASSSGRATSRRALKSSTSVAPASNRPNAKIAPCGHYIIVIS
jgi:hypothetical protein